VTCLNFLSRTYFNSFNFNFNFNFNFQFQFSICFVSLSFFDVSMTTANFISVARPISTFLTQFYTVPLFTSSSSKNLPTCTFYKHSGLTLYQFFLILDLLEKRTISDGGSNDVSLHHIASQPGTSSVLSNQCEFISLCLKITKTQKGGGVHRPLPFVSQWGVGVRVIRTI